MLFRKPRVVPTLCLLFFTLASNTASAQVIQMVNGQVQVIGTGAEDRVTLFETSNRFVGVYVVTPGIAWDYEEFESPESLLISLGGANDTLTINGEVSFAEGVNVFMGSGDDIVESGNLGAQLAVGGNLNIDFAEGFDRLICNRTSDLLVVADDLRVSNANTSTDWVLISNAIVGDDCYIDTGNFVDLITIGTDIVGGSGTIGIGGDLKIASNGEPDGVTVSNASVGGTLSIDTGEADDYLNLTSVEVEQDVRLYTKGGIDNVQLNTLSAGRHLWVETGRDPDDVSMFRVSVAQSTTVKLQRHNDELSLVRCTFGPFSFFDGGSGNIDSAHQTHCTFGVLPGSLNHVRFETENF